MKKNKHLSARERDLISFWRAREIGIREIARRLNRSPSTISDELKRNTEDDVYVAIQAEYLAKQRQRKANEKNPAKDEKIFWQVRDKLRSGWSPEIISGRLKNEKGILINPETIYRYIYKTENKHLNLYEYLPRKQRKRKRQRGRKVHKSRIPNRVSIWERSEEINTRVEFGHWEADTVEGKGHRDGIHTEVERKSRYLQAYKVKAITSEEGITAQLKIFKTLPFKAIKSTTMDNGKENHQHEQLRELGMATYFADPYSSWQRGTNEWHNGLLRRYFPKGTDFKEVSEDELAEVVEEINDRPRKVLEFKTPKEVFDELVNSP